VVRSDSLAADKARHEFAEILERKGHAVDNTRLAMERLEEAFRDGALQRTPELVQALADLEFALAQSEGEKLGGKSAEAARFIGRQIVRLLNDA
jgi:hypothetical protein